MPSTNASDNSNSKPSSPNSSVKKMADVESKDGGGIYYYQENLSSNINNSPTEKSQNHQKHDPVRKSSIKMSDRSNSSDKDEIEILSDNKVQMMETDLMVTEDNAEKLAELTKEEANKLYTAKQYKQALSRYSEAIELCPNNARYYSNRAACYMMLLQYRDALKDAKKCAELDPKFIKAYARIIKCSIMLGDIVEADTTINKLEKYEPSKQSIITELNDLSRLKQLVTDSNFAYSKKDYRKVVYCIDRLIEISPNCHKFKVTKAECLALLKRYQEAEMAANDILHSDKQNADAIYVRGLCLYYEDNIENAFKYFQQVLRLAPDHGKALIAYKQAKLLKTKKEDGNTAFNFGRYEEAYNLYTEALKIDPENYKANAKLHYNKATVAAKLGKMDESIAECSEALKLDENYLKAILRRASCYMERQEYEESVRDYEKACKLDKSRENKRLLMEAKMALKKSKRKDYYKILGIEKNASTDDIKKAYRKRAMVHHPDRHANASEHEKKNQEKKFKEVGEAYGILSDPKKRSRYDNGHDLDESDCGFSDMDIHGRFQAFFDGHGPFNTDYGRNFRFEYY